jgi:hypothetical protein
MVGGSKNSSKKEKINKNKEKKRKEIVEILEEVERSADTRIEDNNNSNTFEVSQFVEGIYNIMLIIIILIF